MRRSSKSFSPVLDVMESRTLLSTGAPLLTVRALDAVVHDVRSIMGRLTRTGDRARASVDLSNLASGLPSGAEELAPAWRLDIARFTPHSPASALGTERRILAALYQYDRSGANNGGTPVSGPISTTGQMPSQTTGVAGDTGNAGAAAPAVSLDSVQIENTTGLALLVTVHLRVPQVQQPYITETIGAAAGSIVTFNFGTATDAFMTMDVSRADGGQSPPVLSDLSLDQPIGGYDGTLFTISLFGPYFNVNPG